MRKKPNSQTGMAQLVASWERMLVTLGPPPNPETDYIQRPTNNTPVTVLSGFLGAGKTTLLCALLSDAREEIVAIVNDLAAIDIDANLIRSRNAEAIELANGCACCSRGDDLVRTLEEITTRPSPPAAIVIEGSGVADPTGIAQAIGHAEGAVLDGIVTVVDGMTCLDYLKNPATASLYVQQVSGAHLIVLNRDTGADIVNQLAAVAPGKAIVPINSEPQDDVAWLLGAAGRGISLPDASRTHDSKVFKTATKTWQDELDEPELFELLSRIPNDVYRIKGFVRVASPCSRELEIQCVGRRWRATPAPLPVTTSTLIAIGSAAGVATFMQRLEATISVSV